jgi:hypothetical protein
MQVPPARPRGPDDPVGWVALYLVTCVLYLGGKVGGSVPTVLELVGDFLFVEWAHDALFSQIEIGRFAIQFTRRSSVSLGKIMTLSFPYSSLRSAPK